MMPNWCENKLVVKGESECLVKFIKKHVVDDELDFKTFSTSWRLFGENHFDTEKILMENITEITFWFDTKWSQNPGEAVCDKINENYPDLEANLSFFSEESVFCGYYTSKGERTYVYDNFASNQSLEDFLEFGEKEGFLNRNEDDNYELVRDTPTPRLSSYLQ